MVVSALMKLAGGSPSFASELNVEAFLQQVGPAYWGKWGGQALTGGGGEGFRHCIPAYRGEEGGQALHTCLPGGGGGGQALHTWKSR